MKKKFLLAAVFILSVSLLTGCQCKHEWIEATCTTAKTCNICKEADGEPLGHTWVDATCTDAKICSTCSLTEGNSLGHEWINASCSTPKTCNRCNAIGGPALGHEISEWSIIQESTCAETGKQVSTCTRCNETIEQEVEKLAHSEGDWVTTREPTSSENGMRQLSCTVCSEVIKEEEIKLSKEEQIALFKKECQKYSYSTIARNPNNYKYEKGFVRGKVIQVIESGNDYTLRVNMNGTYSNTILVSYTKQSSKEDRILEGDTVDMYGYWMGTYTYKTVMGSSLTVPSFDCEYLTIK